MSWDDYLRGFHDRRAGITDEILRRCRSADGLDPYAWLLSATPTKGRMLDVACGNAPLSRYISQEHTYVGVDGSVAELAVAGRPGLLIQADAAALPFDSGGFDVAVCSMALMVITPPPPTGSSTRSTCPA